MGTDSWRQPCGLFLRGLVPGADGQFEVHGAVEVSRKPAVVFVVHAEGAFLVRLFNVWVT